MTKDVLSALASAARGLLRDWRALAALAVLYAALVAACGLFVTTREATAWQLFLTAALAAAIPLLLCVVLAGCAIYAAGERRALPVVTGALKGFWKVAALGLPVLALVVFTVWGMNKLENKVRHDPRAEAQETFASPAETETEAGSEAGSEAGATKKKPVRWKYVFVSALRLLLLGVVLPLLAAQLFIGAARGGIGASLRRLGRAFGPRPVLTYAVGMIVFALLPYFLFNLRTPARAGWLELTLLSLRLGLVFLLTLGGALMTLTALARADGDGEETSPAPAAPPPQPAPRVEETVGAGA
ncbi:MAG: hypothetical protein LC800_14365 [Acidobacteria bacterium]|nr:hypothetical protein [Acidobacteriota bacterium]